jgi:DNA-binding NarL/FixJ family response regulator
VERVLVVDDHQLIAELLEAAVEAQPGFEMVGHAQTVASGLDMVQALQPDIVIMDVRLGDGDGIAATAELTERFPELRVVVLTAFVDQALMQRAAAANACALLPKDGDLTSMLDALRTARRGGFTVHPRLLHRLVTPPIEVGRSKPSLTPREWDVLQLLATGLETRLIAREIGISVHTCRGHVKGLLLKLGAHSQLEAVAKAMQHGMIHVYADD